MKEVKPPHAAPSRALGGAGYKGRTSGAVVEDAATAGHGSAGHALRVLRVCVAMRGSRWFCDRAACVLRGSMCKANGGQPARGARCGHGTALDGTAFGTAGFLQRLARARPHSRRQCKRVQRIHARASARSRAAGRCHHDSRTQLAMNPAYGSWIAFRAVIVLDLPADLGPDPPLREPCPLTPVEKEAARGDDDNALERAQVFAAACAGTAAAVAATPIETIKVALQTWPVRSVAQCHAVSRSVTHMPPPCPPRSVSRLRSRRQAHYGPWSPQLQPAVREASTPVLTRCS